MTDNTQNSTITVGGDINLSSTGVYDYTSVAAGPGGYLLASGSNGISWGDITTDMKLDSVNVKETATFEGDVVIKGKNLADTLEAINKRLNILTVDPELEERWQELKRLGDQYRALEADCIGKEEIIEILNR